MFSIWLFQEIHKRNTQHRIMKCLYETQALYQGNKSQCRGGIFHTCKSMGFICPGESHWARHPVTVPVRMSNVEAFYSTPTWNEHIELRKRSAHWQCLSQLQGLLCSFSWINIPVSQPTHLFPAP